jgi:predicted negative regulator of RcsB-dependent stress response
VVEGADTMREDDVPAWLPTGPGTSAVLVLSRNAQRPLQRAHEAVAVRLGGLGRDAARRLLRELAPESVGDAVDRGEADELIGYVGGNPGALALAGSLLEHRSMAEATAAVRRGEAAIPGVVREVLDALPEDEAALLGALAVCAPKGAPAELGLRIAGDRVGREALDRLIDRAMVVGDGRTVRLVEVVRLEAERRLDKDPEARRVTELAHARAVDRLFGEAMEREDLTTQEDMYADLVVAAERMTARCKEGELEIAVVVAGLGYGLLWYPGGDAGENARLALDAYQVASAVEPENMKWQRGLSVAHGMVGDSLRKRGDTMRALAAYRAGLAISEQLVQQDPTNTGLQRDLSVDHVHVGDVLLAQGDKDGALVAYRASLAIRMRLAQGEPTNAGAQLDHSVAHEKIGDVLLAQGNKKDALIAHQASLAIRARLVEQDPTNAKLQRGLSVSHDRIGSMLLDQGDKGGALAEYRASFAIRERLARHDPANTESQRDLSICHQKIGNVLRIQGDKDGALAEYRASLAIAGRLAQQDPANTELQRDLSVSHEKIGDVLMTQGDGAGALAAYQADLAIAEHLAQQDPANAEWQADLAASSYKLASALPQGTPAERTEARAYLERARRILGDLAATSRLTHEQQQTWIPKIDAALRALPP